MTAGIRREAGIPDGADVFAVLDPDQGTVILTAASRLSAGIAGLFDGLRRGTTGADAPNGERPMTTTPADASTVAANDAVREAMRIAPAGTGFRRGRRRDDAAGPGGGLPRAQS